MPLVKGSRRSSVVVPCPSLRALARPRIWASAATQRLLRRRPFFGTRVHSAQPVTSGHASVQPKFSQFASKPACSTPGCLPFLCHLCFHVNAPVRRLCSCTIVECCVVRDDGTT